MSLDWCFVDRLNAVCYGEKLILSVPRLKNAKRLETVADREKIRHRASPSITL